METLQNKSVICAYCNKDIDAFAKIHNGEVYHPICYDLQRERDKSEALQLTYPNVPYSIIEGLWAVNELEHLEKEWCIVSVSNNTTFQAYGFNTKRELIDTMKSLVEFMSPNVELTIYHNKTRVNYTIKTTIHIENALDNA